MTRVLSGRDLIIVMPTGAGKSACFQVPALVRGGLSLVVSPLIALMKDQVQGLRAKGIAADFVNSTIPAQEQWRRLDRAAAGETRLLYVAPERLTAPSFLRTMEKLGLSLLAVDEAHCISQWGHDFRPAYLGIREFLSKLESLHGKRPQVVALTATATPRVRDDIASQLALDANEVFITGFRRPNLRLLSRRCDDKAGRIDHVLRIAQGVKGSGIVYCGTRRDVEEVKTRLAEAGLSVVAYHAGLDDASRQHAQDAFISGEVDVIVATNAFGMGIDKPDIRFVIHHALPGSIEAYYQEAGRAGRDGRTSYCVLVFGTADRHLHEFFIDGSCPADEHVLSMWQVLRATKGDVIERPMEELAQAAGVPDIQSAACLRSLEDAGLVERLDDRDNAAGVTFASEPAALAAKQPAGTQRRKVVDWLIARFAPRAGTQVRFAPGAAEDDLGLARESILRVLRELSETKEIVFVPPFRGRGIVVKERALTLSQAKQRLKGSFAGNAARRERSLERLGRIVHYAHARACRHGFLLSYFGDEPLRECDACDNCRGWKDETESAPRQERLARPKERKKASSRRPSIDLDEVRPLALRAVADVSNRFGLHVALLVLRGSRSQKVLKAGLENSPVHGSLSRLRQEDVSEALEALEAEGLIGTTGGPYPLAVLTEEGRLALSLR